MSADAARDDLEIAVAATARELRFRGTTEVEIRGDGTDSRRIGLPRPVRAGVTYRRVRATMRAAARLARTSR
jgi:hypothetical protein